MPTDEPGASAAPAALEVTADAFLGGQLTVRQPKRGPRAGLDAVLLAAACPAASGESVLEAGAGSGIVSLAVARRVPGATATGVEIDPALARLAAVNAGANGLAERARFLEGDVTWPSSRFDALGLAPSSFDQVLANPPFLTEGEARLPPDAMLRRAHAATAQELGGWLRFLAAFARPRACLTLIHRADALPKLLPLIEGRFGALVLYPLFPRAGEPANRLLIQGIKGSRRALQIRAGLVVHRAEGGFTPQAEAILRHGAGLTLAS